MKKYILLAVLFLLTLVFAAEENLENPRIIELRKILNDENISDSLNFEIRYELGILFRYTNIDSSTVYAFQALKYAEKTNDYKQLIKSNLSIAQIYKEFHEVYRALEYETGALNLAKANNDSLLLYDSYLSIVTTYVWYTKEYDIAKIYLKQALKVAEALNNAKYQSAINFYFGILYVHQGEFDLSEKYYKKSLEYHESQKDQRNIANCFNNLGDLKEKEGKLEEALNYNRKALEINKEIDDSLGLFINTFNIASIYGKMGKDDEFFHIMTKELNKAQEKNDYSRLQMIYELYYQYYENHKDFENSLKYYKLMAETTEKMNDDTKSIQVRRIEHKHILEKVADQQKIYELQLKNKTTTLSFITALLLLFILLFITSFIYFLKKRNLEELQIKELTTKAELLALQYKINPHFLFNSLNSISQLIIKKSGHAEDMIQNLSDILRYTLTFANKNVVPLGDELETVRQYLSMEKIRFQDRLRFQIDCEDEVKKHSIPPMIILPLAENSIKHGISQLIENGEIYVKIIEEDDFLTIKVKDNGPESENTRPVDPGKNTGFGHQSIIDRLKITYSGNYKFEISNNDEIYCVKISIPINNE